MYEGVCLRFPRILKSMMSVRDTFTFLYMSPTLPKQKMECLSQQSLGIEPANYPKMFKNETKTNWFKLYKIDSANDSLMGQGYQ